jgi:serine/threonine protein phosphatase PrpC
MEQWKSLVRALVACPQDDVLERFLADSLVSEDIGTFTKRVRSHWEQFMSLAPEPEAEPEAEPEPEAETIAAPLAPPEEEASDGLSTLSTEPDPSAFPAEILLTEVVPVTSEPLPPPIRTRPPLKFSLVNGRQSEDFAERPECTDPASTYRLIEIRIPPELGLYFDRKTGFIQGRPAVNGDFTLSVDYRHQDDPPEAVRTSQLNFYVNPDPKLLWKNIPSDQQAPFWKADEATQRLTGASRRLVAARKRGRSHAHIGSCCDDDFFIHYDLASDWYIAIVADGAGSASASRYGSFLAVQTAGNHIKGALTRDHDEKIAAAVAKYQPASTNDAERILHNALYVIVGHAAHKAMNALHTKAQENSGLINSVKDLSTTLLIGIAKKFGNQWLCAAYWVGDGAVAVYRQGHGVTLLGEVDSGEYSGQTRFLDNHEVTQEALSKRTRFTLCPDFTGFLLMTDGVSDPWFETEAQLTTLESWDVLWEELRSNAGLNSAHPDASLLEWLDFWSQGNHDDRTIAIIY